MPLGTRESVNQERLVAPIEFSSLLLFDVFAIGNGRSTCCKSNEWQHEQHEDPVGDGEDYWVNDYQPEEAADQIESVEVQEEEWCLTTDESCDVYPDGPDQ